MGSDSSRAADDATPLPYFRKRALDEEQKWFVHNWVENRHLLHTDCPAINSGKKYLVLGRVNQNVKP